MHGFGHPWQAPLFPHSIGIGATWDPTVAKAGGAATAKAVQATGWNWVFAPVQDLARDNRWGRTYETWAEQPVLASALGAANVKGLQIRARGQSLGRPPPSNISPDTRNRSTGTIEMRRCCR